MDIGTTKIASTFAGISAEVLYFVPMGQNLEIWRLRVKNDAKYPGQIDLLCFRRILPVGCQ